MRKIITIIVSVIVFFVSVAFAAINIEPVSINYYSDSITLPLAVVLIVSLVTGIIIGVIAIYISNLQLRYHNNRLQKRLIRYEQEINNLKTLSAEKNT